MRLLRERLQAALERNAALSQAGLARATGKKTSSVSNWFTGKSVSMKADSLIAAAEYLGCDSAWLASGRGSPEWRTTTPSSAGLPLHTVAHELSPPEFQYGSVASQLVPVVGTLEMGAENMFHLRAAPDGKPIGTVPASITTAGSHALQVFGDDLYPAVRHSTCLVVSTTAPCTAGELVIIETTEGQFMVCELVTESPTTITWSPAAGGQRRTMARSQVTAMHPIVGLVPGSQLRPLRTG